MTQVQVEKSISSGAPTELPASQYPRYQRLLGAANGQAASGLLFDGQTFAMSAVTIPPNTGTPDVMADKDGDRVLILTSGELALQIGGDRYRLHAGDAVQIPRGTPFGATHSATGGQMLWIRSKPVRSFQLLR